MKLHDHTNLQSEFSHIWRAAFGKCPPLGHNLRYEFSDNWTRFHALPESKRYAQTEDDRNTILSRANALVEGYCDEAKKLWIATARYENFDMKSDNLVSKLKMVRAFSWVDPIEEPEDQVQATFYAAKISWEPFSLDWLFTDIAEDRDRAVIFSVPNRTVIAPYDGGFDIVCLQPKKKRDLEVKFRSWASKRPDKL